MMAASWKVVDLHCGIVDTLRSYPEKNFNNFSRGNFNSDGRNHLDPGWINGHSGKSIRVSASSNATWMDRFLWKIKPGKTTTKILAQTLIKLIVFAFPEEILRFWPF